MSKPNRTTLFYNEAIKLCTQAVEADDAAQREKAIAYYSASCEYFLAGRKYDRNPTSRTLVLNRVHQFITRSETLKTSLRSRSAPQPTTKSSSTTSSTSLSKKRPRASTTSVDVGTTTFQDVVGLAAAKQSLIESVILPQKQPQLFTGARKPFNGILLYGPPGTGKTLLVQALANEAHSNFLNISSSDIMSKYQGDSEKAIRDLFQKARAMAPCIIFIDEIDSLGRKRTSGEKASTRRIKTELLAQMDGMGKGGNDGVCVIGATNTPWELDSALRRRFQKRIFTPLPTVEDRKRILKLCLEGESSMQDKDFINIANQTVNFSASDMSTLAREALMGPVRKCLRATHFVQNEKGEVMPCSSSNWKGKKMNIWNDAFDPSTLKAPKVCLKDMAAALKTSKSSVSQSDLLKCQEFGEMFGDGKLENSNGVASGAVASTSTASSSSSSSGGVMSFFGRLFGFGGDELPVAPTAAPLAPSVKRNRMVSAPSRNGNERKAVAM